MTQVKAAERSKRTNEICIGRQRIVRERRREDVRGCACSVNMRPRRTMRGVRGELVGDEGLDCRRRNSISPQHTN